MTRSGLEHTVFLNTLSSQCLCTTWRLDPKALALLPGFCIAVHLLSVLKKHGCFKASPDCCHGRPSLVPQKACMPGGWGEHAHQESLIQAPSDRHKIPCLTCLLCSDAAIPAVGAASGRQQSVSLLCTACLNKNIDEVRATTVCIQGLA